MNACLGPPACAGAAKIQCCSLPWGRGREKDWGAGGRQDPSIPLGHGKSEMPLPSQRGSPVAGGETHLDCRQGQSALAALGL